MAPKKMNLTPTLQEIQQIFPYSFAYFSLPSGKKCIAESTYLGKDYSGRYGNYIIHALIVNPLEISCRPFEFFGEKYIKTEMTTEELNAPSPVPPLPELDIESYGTIINDERLNEFLFEREDEFAKLISFVLESSEKEIPIFLNDTRENLVLWVAATLVRSSESKFKQVRYFNCSSLGHNIQGKPYESKNVATPLLWLLQQVDSGIKPI